MWDGHTAIKHKIAKSPISREGFTFCLTFATLADGRKSFVIHIASNESLSPDAKRWMEKMGMVEFPSCPYLGQRPCFWKEIELLGRTDDPFAYLQQVHAIYHAFDQLCQRFPEALGKLQEASQILAEIGLGL